MWQMIWKEETCYIDMPGISGVISHMIGSTACININRKVGQMDKSQPTSNIVIAAFHMRAHITRIIEKNT
jgi:hypothetical protein